LKTLLTLVVVSLVAACGEPPLSTTEYRDLAAEHSAEYATEAEQLRSSHLSRLEQAVEDLVDEFEGAELEEAAVDETARRTAALFAAVADAVDRYATHLEALVPPAQLQEAHREYVAALRLSISGLRTTLDALEEATSFTEIDAAIGGSTFNDTQYRVDAACRHLESVLSSEGAAADLHCRGA
jgi:hypothetical protein